MYSIQHYVIKFLSDLRQSGVKHHKSDKQLEEFEQLKKIRNVKQITIFGFIYYAIMYYTHLFFWSFPLLIFIDVYYALWILVYNTHYDCMLTGEATNTNLLVFGLTLSGLEPTIYRTQGEHANHYTTDAVNYK